MLVYFLTWFLVTKNVLKPDHLHFCTEPCCLTVHLSSAKTLTRKIDSFPQSLKGYLFVTDRFKDLLKSTDRPRAQKQSSPKTQFDPKVSFDNKSTARLNDILLVKNLPTSAGGRLCQQLQDPFWHLMRLGQHGIWCLGHDLISRERSHLLGHIRVSDYGFRRD